MYASPKRIFYVMPDGSTRIDSPVISEDDVGMTDDEALQRALSRVPKEATKVQVFDRSAIPTTRAERDAWALQIKTRG